MLHFPLHATPWSDWRLPLCDGTAEQLALGLVAGWPLKSSTSCPLSDSDLPALLGRDPALLLWTMLHVSPSTGSGVNVRQHLADWLASDARRQLRWDAADSGQAPPQSAEQCDHAALVKRTIRTAELSRELADTGDEACREAAFLLGMLHHAPSWLTPCASTTSPPTDQLPPPLEDWQARLTAHFSPPAGADAPDCVRQAVELLRDKRARVKRFRPTLRRAKKAATAARRHWLKPPTAASQMLPALAEGVARQAELEDRFATELETEKLEAMAEFAAGAGHEINNPLTVISGRAELLAREEPDPERRRELALIGYQTTRVSEMIADMMLFARPPVPERSETELGSLIEEVVAELLPRATPHGITVTCQRSAAPLPACVDANQIQLALRAMGDNAIQAIGNDGRIEFLVRRSSSGDADGMDSANREMAEIEVRDTGPGISPEVRRHLFDPYYSGYGAGRGLGLGLAKCWRIVTNHGGTVELAENTASGAVFRIRLPLVS